MNIFKNIKWLFTNPPTGITSFNDGELNCEFCNRDRDLWNYTETKMTICHYCIAKVFRKSLKKYKKKKNGNK